ncbi:MAG: serine/threonine-protein kinase [Alphaproteobacteria bacterium]|nr:serine/threonine-protein kinase [Alphaproteobacteria bacterium]
MQERIGSGGFGAVYRTLMVTPGGLERVIALKVLKEGSATPANIARLRDEARLLSLVRHRAIVQVVDIVELSVGWALAMELVEGLDLAAIVRHEALPPRAAFEVVGEVASALHAVTTTEHDGRPLNLVHRDIKPANLLLTAAGTVKLLDFGIASADVDHRHAETQADMVVGTVRYMAMERFEGVCAPPSDIYSLGIVLAELLGRRGYVATDRAKVDAAIRHVRKLAGTEAAALFEAMVDTEPGRRPPAREVARRCRELAPRLPGPALEDWAMEAVPDLTGERTDAPDPADPILGTTLTSEVARPPRRSWARPLAMVAVTAGVAAAAFALGSLIMGPAGVWLGTRVSGGEYALREVVPLDVPRDTTCTSLSSDGTTVAYTSRDEVFVQRIGEAPRGIARVAGTPDSCPVLSPDGALVAFDDLDGHVRIVDLGGREVRAIDAPQMIPEDWGPRGLLLLRSARESELHLLPGPEAAIRPVGTGSAFRMARWDEAGDRILVPRDGEMLWMALDGTTTGTGLHARAADVGAHGVIVLSDWDGHQSGVYTWEPGGEPRLQTHVPGRVHLIAAAPEADRFVLETEVSKVRATRHVLDPDRRALVSSDTFPCDESDFMAIAPDGSGLFTVDPIPALGPGSRPSGLRYAVNRMGFAGEALDQLTTLESVGDLEYGNHSRARARQYYVERRADGTGTLAWFSSDTPGPPQPFLDIGSTPVAYFAVSPDERHVAIDGPDGSLCIRPVAPGAAERCLADVEGDEWLDATRIVVLHDESLGVLDIGTFDIHPLAEDVDYHFGFAVADDQLLVVGEERIAWLSLQTGEQHPLLDREGDLGVIADVTRDGRTLVIAELNATDEVFLLELAWR